MLAALGPIFQNLEETYEAVRIAIGAAGQPRLGWTPSPDVPTFARIVEHIANANLTYASMIARADVSRTWEYDDAPGMEWLLARLDESLVTAREVVNAITEEDVNLSRCDDWCPNCDEQVIQGPLDALWFTLQMARHTAYHLGQLNTYLRIAPAPPQPM